MGKRLIITEQERNYIRGKYGLINEQEVDPSECAKKFVEFALTKSELDGEEIIGGGDLYSWNKNVIPEPGNMMTFNRFLQYLMTMSKKNIFQDGECGTINFVEILPFVLKHYRQTIKKLTQSEDGEYSDPFSKYIRDLYNQYGIEVSPNLRRRMSENSVMGILQKLMTENPPANGIDDEFTYAEMILDMLVGEFIPTEYRFSDIEEELLQYLKENYAEDIFDFFRDNAE
jgi:hypothetical protein